MRENQFKANKVPITNYVPEMMALKSTKNLTGFKDFNFNSTSSLLSVSALNPNYTSRREPSNEGLKNKVNSTSKFIGLKPK